MEKMFPDLVVFLLTLQWAMIFLALNLFTVNKWLYTIMAYGLLTTRCIHMYLSRVVIMGFQETHSRKKIDKAQTKRTACRVLRQRSQGGGTSVVLSAWFSSLCVPLQSTVPLLRPESSF